MVFVAHKVLPSNFEQLVYYIIYLGQVVTIYWAMHSSWIHFYLIILANYDNGVWNSGVDSIYLWIIEDLVTTLLSLRLDAMIIRVIQFIGTIFFHRVIWDPRIQLIEVLRMGSLLRSMAGFVLCVGCRATWRLILDSGTDCLRTSNFKEGRFVMSYFWDIGNIEVLFI